MKKFLLCLLLLTACSQAETVQIGVLVPLTGPLADLGIEMQQSWKLAESKINANSDQKIELIFEDTALDPQQGISATHKLLSQDVEYFFVAGTPVIQAVKPITESKGAVMIGSSITSETLVDTERYIRLYYNKEQAVDHIADFLHENDLTSAASLTENRDFFTEQIDQLEEKDINFLTRETYVLDDSDFGLQLLKIKQADPDVVIIFGYGSSFKSIFEQVRELDMSDTLFVGGLDFNDVPKGDYELYEQAVFVVPTFATYPSLEALEFKTTYSYLYDATASHNGAYAYDSLLLLHQAISETGGSTDAVIAYLKSIGSYEGVVGDIEILSNGDTRSALSFGQYRDGAIVPCETC